MSALRTIRMMTRYTAWANETLFSALAALPDGEATAARQTGFGNMVHTLNHSYVIDQIWRAHLLGEKHGFTARNTSTPPSLATLRENQSTMDRWYIDYADALDIERHDELLQFAFVDGGNGSMTRGDMLLHVVNHKSYHRGYVADMFFQVPRRPPPMDLPVFLRDVPLDL